jgi:hypothetical protein
MWLARGAMDLKRLETTALTCLLERGIKSWWEQTTDEKLQNLYYSFNIARVSK